MITSNFFLHHLELPFLVRTSDCTVEHDSTEYLYLSVIKNRAQGWGTRRWTVLHKIRTYLEEQLWTAKKMKTCHLCPFPKVKKHPTAIVFHFRFCSVRLCWGQCPFYRCLSGLQAEGPRPLAHTSIYNYPVYKVLFWKAKQGTTGNCILQEESAWRWPVVNEVISTQD